jgi:glycosyltransferase involved in cell wall biosynthesis
MQKKKILFVVQHRKGRSPGQRFRFEQYLEYIEKNGFEYEFSPLLDAVDDKRFYAQGNLLGKLIVLIKSTFRRIKDTFRAKEFDIIFIYREAFMLGTTFFEKQFKKSGSKIVFDFDDAIWLPNVSEGNKKLQALKNHDKTKDIINLSDVVIAGNKYLQQYAGEHNNNTVIIPTTIDTNYHVHKKVNNVNKNTVVIGWTGTASTLQHYETIIPVLIKLRKKYSDKISFRVIADKEFKHKDIQIDFVKWSIEDEIEQLQQIDIGIMPLPDDKWSKGKCGFKGLQYMGLSIPTVMSPVGVNEDIIEHEKNGFLANSEEEWISILSKLIDNEQLRSTIGDEGRKTIIDKYSVDAWKDEYVKLFRKLSN